MYLLFIILLIINIGLIIYLLIKNSFNKDGLEINHIFLFLVGLLFYMIIPILVGLSGLFKEQVLMSEWYEIYNMLTAKQLVLYMLVISIFLISLYLGNRVSSMFLKKSTAKYMDRLSFHISYDHINSVLKIIYIVSLIPLVYFLIDFSDSFFKSYTSEENLSNAKGSFVALSLVYLSMSFFHGLYNLQQNKNITFARCFINLYSVTYLFVALLILSLGGRLYFLTSFLMYIVLWSVYHKKISKRSFLLAFIVIPIVMGTIGVIRLGSNVEGYQQVIFNIFAESLYTSFSLVSFLRDNSIKIIEFPIIMLSELLNFIPSFIFPNKVDYFISPESKGYEIYSPLGALNSFVSFMVNFGILGSSIFIFCLSFLLDVLKKMGSTITYIRVIYIMLSGWLVFSFFRDPFSVSIIKNMIQFSILVPLFFLLMAKAISIYKRVRNDKNENWN